MSTIVVTPTPASSSSSTPPSEFLAGTTDSFKSVKATPPSHEAPTLVLSDASYAIWKSNMEVFLHDKKLCATVVRAVTRFNKHIHDPVTEKNTWDAFYEEIAPVIASTSLVFFPRTAPYEISALINTRVAFTGVGLGSFIENFTLNNPMRQIATVMTTYHGTFPVGKYAPLVDPKIVARPLKINWPSDDEASVDDSESSAVDSDSDTPSLVDSSDEEDVPTPRGKKKKKGKAKDKPTKKKSPAQSDDSGDDTSSDSSTSSSSTDSGSETDSDSKPKKKKNKKKSKKKDNRTFWQRWTTVTTTLDPKDRSMFKDFTSTVRSLPGRVGEQIKGLASDFVAAASKAGMPQNLTQFVIMLCDCIQLALTTDKASVILQNTRMALQYGFLPTLIIDGLAIFVKQFTKRIWQAEEQDDAVKEDEANTTGMRALFSSIYYYTIGSFPTIVPADAIKALIALNAGFQLARNIEHFGAYLLTMIKGAVNLVWKLIFKRDFFDAEQRKVIDKMASFTARANDLYETKSLTRADIRDANALARKGTILYAKGSTCGVPKAQMEAFKRQHDALQAWIGEEAGIAQYRDQRPPCVITHLIGAAGVGKSTIITFTKAALMRNLGHSGDPAAYTIRFDASLNFPPNPPPHALFIDFDDGFLVTTPDTYATLVSALQKLGTGGPFQMDAASLQKKDRLFYDCVFAFGTDNILPSNLPVTTEEPVARRYNGGLHLIKLNPKYYEPGTKKLDVVRVTKWNDAGAVDKLNKVWVFVDHNGVQRNFQQFVSMLIAVHRNTLSVGSALSSAVMHVGASFETCKAVVSKAPKSLNLALNNLAAYFPEALDKPTGVKPKPLPKDPKGTVVKSATEQSFVNKDDDKAFRKWIKRDGKSHKSNDKLAHIAKGYMEASSAEYKFRKGKLTKNGVTVDPASLHGLYIEPEETQDINLKVPVKRWTHATLEAMHGETFYITSTCCRYENYCYRHGRKACSSYGPDAIQSGFAAVSHWVMKNTDLNPRHRTYHEILIDSYSKKEESLAYVVLRATLVALASASVGLLVGHLFGTYFGTFFAQATPQSGYARRGSLIAAKAGSSIPVATLGAPNIGTASPQVDETKEVHNTNWLVEKLSHNVLPISVHGGNKTASCQMTRVVGNLAVTVAHAFFEGAHEIAIGGMIGTVLPIVHVANASAFTDMGPVVQVLRDKKIDLAILLLPKALPPCKNIMKYLVRTNDTSVAQMRQMSLAVRTLKDPNVVMLDSRRVVVPEPLEALHDFPLGDAVEAVEYNTPTLRLGISIRMAKPTLKKMCGFPAFTNNHYVGRGHEILGGIHGAKHDYDALALMVPTPFELFDRLLKEIPASALNMVVLQGSLHIEPVANPINDRLVPVHTMPPGHGQYQNTHNTIRPSPIYDALIGMSFIHPVTQEKVVIAAPAVAPSPIWELKKPFDKVVLHDHVPKLEDYNRLKDASKVVRDRILHFADPRLVEPQTDLFTIHQALNGVPDLNIPGLDPTKSFGYHKDFPKHVRKMCLKTTVPLVLFPQYEAVVEKSTQDIKSGKFPLTYVVANLKEELRRIGKASRVTSCFNFLLLIVMRRFNMHIPAMFLSGRVHNGTSFGADLSGPEGKTYEDAAIGYDLTSTFDAKNFDASISSTVNSLSEETFAIFTRMRHPFLSWEAAMIPLMLHRICLLLIGMIAYMVWHGRQSGGNLTTPFNITDALTVAQAAWDTSDRDYRATLVNSAVVRAYGDDFRADHNNRSFTNMHLSAEAAKYGITLTPGLKYGTPSEFDPVRAHLARMALRDESGYYFAPLNVDVIDHIHAFIRGKDRNYHDAVRQNAEASLREWFQYKREIFEMAKARINASLKRNGFAAVPLDFDELYIEWLNKNGVYVRKEQPIRSDNPFDYTFDSKPRYLADTELQAEVKVDTRGDVYLQYPVDHVDTALAGRRMYQRDNGSPSGPGAIPCLWCCTPSARNCCSYSCRELYTSAFDRAHELFDVKRSHRITLYQYLESHEDPEEFGAARVYANLQCEQLGMQPIPYDWAAFESPAWFGGDLPFFGPCTVQASFITNSGYTKAKWADRGNCLNTLVGIAKSHDEEMYNHARAYLSANLVRAGQAPITAPYNQMRLAASTRRSERIDVIPTAFVAEQVVFPNIGNATPQSDTKTQGKPVSVPAEKQSTSADHDTTTSMAANEMVINPVSTTAGVVSQNALTKHVESTVKSVSKPTPTAALSYRWELNPYPPVGVEKMLEKEYELGPIVWNTADNRGTPVTANIPFPEALFTIPKIVELLGAIRYFKMGILFKVSMVPNPYAGGRLVFTYCQATTTAGSWRQAWPLCLNLPGVSIGPCLGGTRSMELVPASHSDAYDIVNLAPAAMVGVIRGYILNKLSWMSGTPPANQTVNMYIQVVSPTLAGYGLNAGPSMPESWSSAKKKYTKTTPQSAMSEAGDKASKGILDGVMSAVKTVSAVVEDAGPLLELAALDKPYENATTQPVRIEVASDLVHTKGVMQAPMLSTQPNSYVSTTNDQCFETDPQPRWDSVFGTPGYIDYFEFDYNTSAGTKVWETVVSPTKGYLFQADTDYENYLMAPVGYFAMWHRYWHGHLLYLFRFSTASQQSCSVRISLLPNSAASTAVPRDQAGDVESVVYDIKGDTDIFVPAYFLSRRKMCYVEGPGAVGSIPFGSNSRLLIQVNSPVSADVTAASAKIMCDVYMCALPGFKLVKATDVSTHSSGMYYPAITPESASWNRSNKNIGRSTPQAAVRDLMGQPSFPPLSPSQPKTHRGMVDPDRTSGVVELLKRFRRIEFETALPYTAVNAAPDQSDHQWLIYPWAYWSGSVCFKVCLAQVATTTRGFLNASPAVNGYVDVTYGSGVVMIDLAKQSFLSFAIPYMSLDAVTEVENAHTEAVYQQALVEYAGSDDIPEVDVYTAVGDDYCLYRFQCCPLFVYQLPGATKKGKGKERASRATVTPMSDDE